MKQSLVAPESIKWSGSTGSIVKVRVDANDLGYLYGAITQHPNRFGVSHRLVGTQYHVKIRSKAIPRAWNGCDCVWTWICHKTAIKLKLAETS